MIYLPESEEIYFPKTREYFDEVMSSYSNGNYRSAIVMLYTTVIYDLYHKLKELEDMYDDKSAKAILLQIDSLRNNGPNYSEWEKKLINELNKQTEIINVEEMANIEYLIKLRNLSAHPALNDNYELYTPSKEVTIALIRNCLFGIFIKPPIFISNVVNSMSEDIRKKRELFGNAEILEKYLNNKYFSKMTEPMIKTVFKAYWKFSFNVLDNEECNQDRFYNQRVILILLNDNYQMLLEYIKNEKAFQVISNDDDCMKNLNMTLAEFPSIYSILKEENKALVTNYESKNMGAKLISWYKEENKTKHIDKLIEENANLSCFDSKYIEFMENSYRNEGILEKYLDLLIFLFSKSGTFNEADARFDSFISSYLTEFTIEQYVKIFEAINKNSQIYNRNAAKSTNTKLIKSANSLYPELFSGSNYPNIEFWNDEVFSSETIENGGN